MTLYIASMNCACVHIIIICICFESVNVTFLLLRTVILYIMLPFDLQ